MRKAKAKMYFIITFLSVISGFLFHFRRIQNEYFSLSAQISATQNHRRDTVRFICHKNNITGTPWRLKHSVARQIYVEHTHKFVYCEVPKAGCSNWKRIILLLNSSLGLTAGELNHSIVHESRLLKRLSSYSPTQQVELLNNYTTVMFARDPLERLVSAYRDKFLHDDEYYYSKTVANNIKKKVRKNGNSTERVSFEEFVRFIVSENPHYRDIHWMPMLELCNPCNIHYDIVGKFETITQDAAYVLRSIRAPKHLKYPDIKHHSNDSRTNDLISKNYFRSLPKELFQKLINVYRLDFSMFEYNPYNYK
ncbi:hypothetical protein XENTR_v10021935 [Xenopus tropicalis]|uniref:Carbohydrate sulfotransferase n=1 Tax=Xenopus tropicalis TaxID=8364 RepID=A0A6I8PLK4_XENTR|nr:carbohydrate sulfotransferase 9-like [Xenopus tropicalis]KAE8587336.1 hypothetical protein XENTR_v10021935 [Xenopus tropicalis]